MPETFLFTVEAAFQISGRPGLVLAPGIPATSVMASLKVGSSLRLLTPDGRQIDTYLASVELLNYGARPVPEPRHIPIVLPSTLSKAQVPPGTRVMALGVGEPLSQNGA